MVFQVIQQRWWLSLVMLLIISTAKAQERDATTPQRRSMQRRAPVRDMGRNFQVTAPSYMETERQNLVVQNLDYSCGTACLATVAKYFWGDDYNEAKFIAFSFQVLSQEEFQNRVQTGLTMADLKAIAEKAGYFSTVGRLTFDQLTKSKIPVIVGITVNKYKHFVVFRGFDGESVYLGDPIRGNIWVTRKMFQQQWQRQLVLVVAKRVGNIPVDSPLLVSEKDRRRGKLNGNMIRRNVLPLHSVF